MPHKRPNKHIANHTVSFDQPDGLGPRRPKKRSAQGTARRVFSDLHPNGATQHSSPSRREKPVSGDTPQSYAEAPQARHDDRVPGGRLPEGPGALSRASVQGLSLLILLRECATAPCHCSVLGGSDVLSCLFRLVRKTDALSMLPIPHISSWATVAEYQILRAIKDALEDIDAQMVIGGLLDDKTARRPSELEEAISVNGAQDAQDAHGTLGADIYKVAVAIRQAGVCRIDLSSVAFG